MPSFAKGKRSLALCDRCGQRYPYDKIKPEIENRRPNGLRVCPSCMDEDHPQLQLGRQKIRDPQALRNPRPDRTEPASVVALFGQRFPHTAGTNEFTLMSATMRMASEMTTTSLLVSGSAAASMTSEFTQTAAAEVTQASPSYTTLTVTVASGTNSYGTGNKYYIAGLSGASPTVTLNEGTTYRFDQSDASNSGHPFALAQLRTNTALVRHHRGDNKRHAGSVVPTRKSQSRVERPLFTTTAPTTQVWAERLTHHELHNACSEHQGFHGG